MLGVAAVLLVAAGALLRGTKAHILSSQNGIPIVFYGRLEDQFGAPVAGAEIAGSTVVYSGLRSGAEHVSARSDSSGYFEMRAGRGESLGIMPAKQGYVLATTGTDFKYSHLYAGYYVPDPYNPTVIKMWRLQGAEPLLSINQNYRLIYTNAPICFDFLTGKVLSEGGDLRMTLSRPRGVISQQHPQDWSIEVEVLGGGLVQTSQEEAKVTFSAPDAVYESKKRFGNNNGPDLVDTMLFVQSRNGRMNSKLHLMFQVNDNPDGNINVAFNGVANTNGSRNWEATAVR
jgi:hypothetical protein